MFRYVKASLFLLLLNMINSEIAPKFIKYISFTQYNYLCIYYCIFSTYIDLIYQHENLTWIYLAHILHIFQIQIPHILFYMILELRIYLWECTLELNICTYKWHVIKHDMYLKIRCTLKFYVMKI